MPHATVDHQVFHRFDARTPGAIEALLAALTYAAVPFVSINDYVPGQGQFNDLAAYRACVRSFMRGEPTEAEVDEARSMRMERAAASEDFARETLARVAATARQYDLPLCSHDDDLPARVDLMGDIGCTIAEFPLTVAAAERARARYADRDGRAKRRTRALAQRQRQRPRSRRAWARGHPRCRLPRLLAAGRGRHARRARPRGPAHGDPPCQRDPGGAVGMRDRGPSRRGCAPTCSWSRSTAGCRSSPPRCCAACLPTRRGHSPPRSAIRRCDRRVCPWRDSRASMGYGVRQIRR
jgi:hypothetical protein